MSRLVVVEGIDGAGKTTLVKGLVAALQQKGFAVVYSREPGGTPKAEAIRAELFSKGDELSFETQMAMVHEGRMDHVKNFISPALEEGKVVVLDRFEMSSLVYQVWHEKERLEPIYKKYEAEIAKLLGSVTPEYLFLTLSPEMVQQRQLQSGELNVFDAVELEPIKDRLAAYEYACSTVRGKVSTLDASPTPDILLEEALKILKLN
jgi:dTMP kinase